MIPRESAFWSSTGALFGTRPRRNSRPLGQKLSSAWQGCAYQAMNPIDQVLYLYHGGEHAWIRAKWLGDLARIHAVAKVDWEAALEQARASRQEKPLFLGLRLLNILHALPLPRLPGNPWEQLSPFLVDSPLYALQMDRDLFAVGALDLLPELLRFFRTRGRFCREKTGAKVSPNSLTAVRISGCFVFPTASTGLIHPCVPFFGFGATYRVAGWRKDNTSVRNSLSVKV